MTIEQFNDLWATWLEMGNEDRYVRLVTQSDGSIRFEVVFTDEIGGTLSLGDYDSLMAFASHLESESKRVGLNES